MVPVGIFSIISSTMFHRPISIGEAKGIYFIMLWLRKNVCQIVYNGLFLWSLDFDAYPKQKIWIFMLTHKKVWILIWKVNLIWVRSVLVLVEWGTSSCLSAWKMIDWDERAWASCKNIWIVIEFRRARIESANAVWELRAEAEGPTLKESGN